MKRFALLTMIVMASGMNAFAAEQCTQRKEGTTSSSSQAQDEQGKTDKENHDDSKVLVK